MARKFENIILKGNLGGGTETPTNRIHIIGESAGDTTVKLESFGNVNAAHFFGFLANEPRFYMQDTGSQTRIKLDVAGDSWFTGGNLGIGTSSPTSKLQIDSTTTPATPLFYISNTATLTGTDIIRYTGNAVNRFIVDDNGRFYAGGNTDKLDFVFGNTAPFKIGDSFSFGTSGSSTSMSMKGGTHTTHLGISDGFYSVAGNVDDFPMILMTNNTARIRMNSGTGEVGLNLGFNVAATAQLHVKGSGTSSATYAIKIDNNSSSSLFYLTDAGTFGLGLSTTFSGNNNFAIGGNAQVSGNQGLAVGFSSNSSGLGALAIGYNSVSSSDGTVALGSSASASGGTGAIAIGSATASQGQAIAIGQQASSSGSQAISMGYVALAAHQNSIVIGLDITSTSSRQLVFGLGAGDADREVFIGNGVEKSPDQIGVLVLQPTHVANGNTDGAAKNFIISGSKGTGTGVGGDILFKVAPAGLTGSTQNSLIETMRISSLGSVGIGTASPSSKLHVVGNLKVDGNLTVDGNSGSFTGSEHITKQSGVQTTNDTETNIATVSLNDGEMIQISAEINGFASDFSAAYASKLWAVFRKTGGTVTQVGATITGAFELEDFSAAVNSDIEVDGTAGIKITVQAVASPDITVNWVTTYSYFKTLTNS